jgi:TolB protein
MQHPPRSPAPAVRRRRGLVRLALVALAGSLAFAAAQSAANPAGLIAYVDADGRTAVRDPRDGAPPVVFGGGLERAQFPAWSSDGNHLAVIVGDMSGGRVDLIEVARAAAPTTVYRPAGRAPIYLAWSPDDRTLAVLANRAGGGLALDLVDVARAAAGEPDAVVPFAQGAPLYWSWSRTGRALLVHVDVMGPTRLAGVTGIDAFDVRRPLPDPGAFQSPAFSASERYVAYATLTAGGERRVVVAPNPELPAAGLFTRTLPHRGQAALAWRPGSEQLAVQSAAVPAPHAFGPVDLLDVASGDVTRLTDDPVVASWWSPDGRWLATLSPVGGGGDRTVQASAGPGTAGASWAGDAADATAAVHVVDQRVQRGSALLSLKVIDADTLQTLLLGAFVPSPLFAGQYLPFFDQYARSHRLWSPDSDALVMPVADDDGAVQLVVFGLDGEVTPLGPGDMPAWNVR